MSSFKIDWIIDNVLAASSRPKRTDLQTIWKQGIRIIVTLRSNPLPNDWLADFQFEYLHLPIRDFSTPTFKQINHFVKFTNSAQKSEQPVLVHCFAGLGRTGTMISCYLVTKGMTAEKAVQFVRQIRPGSVETIEQLKTIKEYEKRL